MAKMTVVGVDKFAEELSRMGDGADELADEMLKAGATETVKAWRDAIDKAIRHPERSTGDMKEAVAATEVHEGKGGVKSVEVYPQGKDRKGVSNAKKAYIHHYGRPNHQIGSRFVDEAEKNAEQPTYDAMAAVFDEYIEKNGGSNHE